MNKLTKVLLGAGAFLVMSGGLLALGGRLGGADTGAMSLSASSARISGLPVTETSGDERAVDPSGYLERDQLEPFTKLKVDIALGDVTVQSGDSFGLRLSWSGGIYDLNYTQEEDGTLRVFSRSKRSIPHGLTADALICIPQGTTLEELTVYNGLGDVNIQDITAGELTAECSLGSLSLWDCTLEEAELVNSMGSIDAYGLTVTQNLEVEAAMGSITIEGDLQGEIDIQAGMGEVELQLSQAEERYNYSLETGMGEVYVDGESQHNKAGRSGAPHTLEVENGMGDIWVGFSE